MVSPWQQLILRGVSREGGLVLRSEALVSTGVVVRGVGESNTGSTRVRLLALGVQRVSGTVDGTEG